MSLARECARSGSPDLTLFARAALYTTLCVTGSLFAVQPVAAQDGASLSAGAAVSTGSAPVSVVETDTSKKAERPGAASQAADQAGDQAKDDAAAEKLPWDLLHRRYNTWYGPSGGLFLVDGSTGEVGALRVSLGLGLYSGDSVLLRHDHVEQDQQVLALSWTAAKLFEVYATLANMSTATSLPKADTQTSLGDMAIGGKVGGKVAPLFYVSGDLRAAFANQVGGGGTTLGATNLGLRGELSAHFEELSQPLPLVVRLNVGYLFDNTSQIVSDIEDTRYSKLNPPVAAQANETRHLVNRFERLAMGINRLDRMTFGLGLEMPLEVSERFYMHPLVEWRIDVPVNRQGYDCPFVKNAPSGTTSTAQDSCYERTSSSAFPMNLALGVRAVPPIRGVSVLLGVDFGLKGTNRFVRELSPNLPYRLLLALSYDYDARPVAPPPAPPAPEPKAPPTGRVQGTVTSSEGGPVAGAIVSFVDHDVSAVASSSDGHFISEAFAPGEVHMEASHPDYEPAQCGSVIPDLGGNVEAQCVLTPKARAGGFRGHVIDAWGAPVSGARVQLGGPTTASATSDVRGNFEAANLQPGDYAVRTEADGYFVRLSKAALEARTTGTLDLTLIQKPIEPRISVTGQTIVAKNLKFVGATTELDDAGAESVAEIADLMLTRTDMSIRIQGYGDDAVALSRALLIKQRLVDAGVPESRLEAIGGGRSRVAITINR